MSKTQKAETGTNIGFKIRNSSVCTYRQVRNGLNYFYCKRKVSNDGISTERLARDASQISMLGRQ